MRTPLKIPDVSAVARMAEIKDQEIAEIMERERKKKSPFRIWTQQNNDPEAQKVRFWLMKKSPIAYCVMDFLASNMDHFNAVLCSYKVMQEIFGYSRASLAEAIKLLREHKFIDVQKTGTSNIYMINKQLYWNSWGTNYAYAEFGAKIIISSSDQDKETQERIRLEIKKRQEVVMKPKTQLEKSKPDNKPDG